LSPAQKKKAAPPLPEPRRLHPSKQTQKCVSGSKTGTIECSDLKADRQFKNHIFHKNTRFFWSFLPDVAFPGKFFLNDGTIVA
jgi:hypothetical protein